MPPTCRPAFVSSAPADLATASSMAIADALAALAAPLPGAMVSSAVACLDDARRLHLAGDYRGALRWSHASAAYSVGVFADRYQSIAGACIRHDVR